MSLTGHVEKGVIVLDAPLSLPDGTEVEITVRTAAPPAPSDAKQTHFERLQDVIGAGVGLPADFARNHDHYIRGTPKR